MPTDITTLVRYCDALLAPHQFKDYCPNGLQVAGKTHIDTIVSGVTASQALLDEAAMLKADLVLVHHGLFWQGDSMVITGMKRRRLHTLLQHDMNLLAYHLPLDAHTELGNNVQLAKELGLSITGTFETGYTPSIGLVGTLPRPMSGVDFALHLEKVLRRKPLHIPGHDRLLETIAWCTGAAQDYIQQASDCQVDAYLSGEISERTTHSARELHIDYFSAGHHATERCGVNALGRRLAEVFKLSCHFIGIDNPV